MNEQIRLRPANEEDIPFIFSSWLKSFRSSLFASKLVNSVYFTEHHKVIEKIVKNSHVIVACNDQDPTQIYGYIVAGTVDSIFCLHYVYTKHPFRRMGIARLLINFFEHSKDLAGIYTHHTRAMDDIAPKFNLVHQPYIWINDYIKEPSDE
jgi:GNAT superfamily N-acetyltransferase